MRATASSRSAAAFAFPTCSRAAELRWSKSGLTNRVYVEDFERALTARTALLLRTHASNYAIEGFTHDVTARELAELGRRCGVPVVEDLGGGAVCDLAQYGLADERTVQQALADGAQLVTFSGDKLLGGPQAGIVVGRANAVARLRSNPLLRALRVDKMTLAALGATLALHRDPATRDRIPIIECWARRSTSCASARVATLPPYRVPRSSRALRTSGAARCLRRGLRPSPSRCRGRCRRS